MKEYDDACEAGRRFQLHRVCHLLFSKDTECRRQLEGWLASQLPLKSFPVAFFLIQNYALVSLVERRIEAVHAMIKKIGAGLTYVLPPYICARLRESFHLDLLNKNVEFYKFCIRRWRSRSVINELLMLRCTQSELAKMTMQEKIKVVYQCSLECEFESTAAPRREHSTWLAIANPQVKVEIPELWKLCIEYWKSSLHIGGFYTLPRDLFALASEASHDPIDLTTIPDPPSNFLLSAGSAGEISNSSSVVCFEVLRTRPESRWTVPIKHDLVHKTKINIRLCDTVGLMVDGKRMVVTNSSSAKQCSLDLLSFIRAPHSATHSLFRWRMTKRLPVFELLPCSTLQINQDVDTYVQPCVVGSKAAIVSMAPAASLVPLHTLQSRPNLQLVLSQFERTAAWDLGGQGPLSIKEIDAASLEVVNDLVEYGALVRTGLSGAESFFLRRAAVTRTVAVGLVDPTPHVRVSCSGTCLQWSKLHLVLQLQYDGWQPSTENLDAWKPGGPSMYKPLWSQPLSYFAALFSRTFLVSKGITSIRHGMSDVYYRCLLRLKSSAVVEMLRSLDEKTSDDLKNLLKDRSLLDQPDAEIEDEVDSKEDAGAEAIEDEPVNVAVGGAITDLLFMVPPIVESGGFARQILKAGRAEPLKIYFDHFSGGTGGVSMTQRGFCNCSKHACIKYRTVGDESLEDFCAWMLAWHRSKLQSKAAHLNFEPSSDQIQKAREEMHMAPF